MCSSNCTFVWGANSAPQTSWLGFWGGEWKEKREGKGKWKVWEGKGRERNERKVEGDKGVERGKKGKERKGRMEGEGRNLVQL